MRCNSASHEAKTCRYKYIELYYYNKIGNIKDMFVKDTKYTKAGAKPLQEKERYSSEEMSTNIYKKSSL